MVSDDLDVPWDGDVRLRIDEAWNSVTVEIADWRDSRGGRDKVRVTRIVLDEVRELRLVREPSSVWSPVDSVRLEAAGSAARRLVVEAIFFTLDVTFAGEFSVATEIGDRDVGDL